MQIKRIFFGIFWGVTLIPLFAMGQNLQTVYCPAPSALSKNPLKQTWSASGGFKGYDLSFVTQVTGFLGAQWRGATVGQITCVYKGLPKNSFNVLLIYNTVTYEPSQLNWAKNQGGVRNCIARKTKHCPFSVEIKPKNKGDIYQQLEKFKS